VKVNWSAVAKWQLQQVYLYWLERNESVTYPEKILTEAYELADVIKKNPKAFKKVRGINARIAPMGDFSIVYTISGKAIFVVSFWDNRQSPKKLRKLLEVHRGKK
jgi:hypothetical protein